MSRNRASIDRRRQAGYAWISGMISPESNAMLLELIAFGVSGTKLKVIELAIAEAHRKHISRTKNKAPC